MKSVQGFGTHDAQNLALAVIPHTKPLPDKHARSLYLLIADTSRFQDTSIVNLILLDAHATWTLEVAYRYVYYSFPVAQYIRTSSEQSGTG
jgi:hypothetical protein